MMSDKVRAFLALELPEEIRRSLGDITSRLALPQFRVRWVAPENMHLTFHFLGDVGLDEIRRVSEVAIRTAGRHTAFSIRLAGLGTFPPSGPPRIIWAGIEGEAALVRLAEDLDIELMESGFPPPDKPFKPHLTLGRVKDPRGIGEMRRLLETNRNAVAGGMGVDHISLFKSVLRPAGPEYSVMDRFRLSKNDSPKDGSQGGDIS